MIGRLNSLIRVFVRLVLILIAVSAFARGETAATVRISAPATLSSTANGESIRPSSSADGRYVAFESYASNLVPNDINRFRDIFLHDTVTGSNQLVSISASGIQGNGDSSDASVSADGRYVAFQSYAWNLSPIADYGVYVHDMVTGSTTLASVSSAGVPGDGENPAISADGRFVIFESGSPDLADGDTNGMPNIFVHDMQTGMTQRVNVASDGAVADLSSSDAHISGDGTLIVFISGADNLVSQRVTGPQVYLRNLALGTTSLVSPGTFGCAEVSISANGRYVAFTPYPDAGPNYIRDMQTGLLTTSGPNGATHLCLSGDGRYLACDVTTPITRDIVVTDLVTSTSTVLNSCTDPTASFADRPVSISEDGSKVAFQSYQADLVPADNNGTLDVFSSNVDASSMSLISSTPDPVQAGDGHDPAVSGGGRYVAYDSSEAFASDDTNKLADIYVRDTLTGTVKRVSLSSAGAQGNFAAATPSISSDGRYVSFTASSNNLVPGDTNNAFDIFVRDIVNSATERISVASIGTQGNGNSDSSSISASGDSIAFTSVAANLVPNDTNGKTDVFIRVRSSSSTLRASVSSTGVQGNGDSTAPMISSDGSVVAFQSDASNLVSGDTNAKTDVFVRNIATGVTEIVSIGISGAPGNGASTHPSVSADGRFVAFQSRATNLVNNPLVAISSIYVRDRVTQTTVRIEMPVNATYPAGIQGSYSPSISGDGRYVAFASDALSDLTYINGGDYKANLFIHDMVENVTVCADVSATGKRGNDGIGPVSLSSDGHFVAYGTTSNNLMNFADLNGGVFLSGPVFADASTYTFDDVRSALLIAGGLMQSSPSLTARLDVAQGPGGNGFIDLLDALSIARKVVGLDFNP